MPTTVLWLLQVGSSRL